MASDTQDRSPDQVIEAATSSLAQAAANAAFQLFSDAQFRRLTDFDRLSQVEQDRIFNELMVAFLVLSMLVSKAPDLRVDDEIRDFAARVGKGIPGAHLEQLKALGIEKKHLLDWEKLISMRYEEYARDRHDVRAAAMRIESSEKELDMKDHEKIQMFVPVPAVAIGCHQHICRGETQGRDELFKLLLKALSPFYVELRIRLEGRKISPLTKLKMTFMRVFRR